MTLNLQPQSAASNDGPTEMSPSPMPQNVWPPPHWVTYMQQFQHSPPPPPQSWVVVVWTCTLCIDYRLNLCLYGHVWTSSACMDLYQLYLGLYALRYLLYLHLDFYGLNVMQIVIYEMIVTFDAIYMNCLWC